MMSFDPARLSRQEKRAWFAMIHSCGRMLVDEMFATIVLCAAKRMSNGATATEIRECVNGTVYDNTSLMFLGKRIRNATLIVAKAMVEQAIEAVTLAQPRPADTSHVGQLFGDQSDD